MSLTTLCCATLSPIASVGGWRSSKTIPRELDRTMVAGQLDVTVPVLMNSKKHKRLLFLGMNALKEVVFPETGKNSVCLRFFW